MGKKKIALFYDEDTEKGREILEFLMPFDKRKSDIVGELILLWIAEHGTNVPVQWLDRKREAGVGELRFPERVAAVGSEAGGKAVIGTKEKSEEEVQDLSMIKAGLAAFM